MLLLEGLATLCNTIPGCAVTAQSSGGQQALADIQRLKPDIALLDLDLTDLLTLEVIRQIRAGGSKTRCAVLSARKDRKTVLEALRSGACGFILKSSTSQHLADAFQHILQGGIYVSPAIEMASLVAESSTAHRNTDPLDALSSREYQVFMLLVEGIRAKEIAARLSLSPKTVDTYRSSLMRKLNIFDLAGLVKFAIQRNLVS
jgi:Response regulator containing a CheY-like receiver domain and an HTH DNA-binding domain